MPALNCFPRGAEQALFKNGKSVYSLFFILNYPDLIRSRLRIRVF